MKWAREFVMAVVITAVLVTGGMVLIRLFDEWMAAIAWGF
jgi:hypothetical protein